MSDWHNEQNLCPNLPKITFSHKTIYLKLQTHFRRYFLARRYTFVFWHILLTYNALYDMLIFKHFVFIYVKRNISRNISIAIMAKFYTLFCAFLTQGISDI